MPNLSDFAPPDFAPLISSIESQIFTPMAPLRVTAWLTKEPVPFSRRRQGKKISLAPGSTWGTELFDCAWFLFEGKLVKSSAPLALLIDVNGEICLYDEKGVPQAGLTSVASSFDPLLGKPGKRVFWLSSKSSEGRSLRLWGDAGYNDLFGKISGNGKLVEAQIVSCNEAIRQLYYDVVFLVDYFKVCPAQTPLSRRLKAILNDVAASWSPREPESIDGALAAIDKFRAMKPGTGLLNVTAVGHAHLDLAWLWPEREGKRKAVRTLATAIRMIDRYPEYRFCASQAQMFAWIKKAEPILFRRIVGSVKKGNIELVGDSWVEADTNISSGEALIRQILEGRAFFHREFGTRSKVMFLPDVFGYSAALPQIMKGCGLEYFMTQKLSWNKVNRFPHQSFWWEGLDGSRVLTHMLPEETYNGTASPAGMLKLQNNYAEIGINDQALSLYGIGDGGGGPGEEHLENLRRAAHAFGLPQVRQGSVGGFFKAFSRNADKLPRWKGELYMEGHQGTLTTHAEVKYGNRRSEILLREVEWLLAAEKAMGSHPQEKLGPIWRDTLFFQFHDILPGSSIRRVYQEALPVYRKRIDELTGLQKAISNRVARKLTPPGSNLMVTNSLPWKREGWVLDRKKWRRFSAPALGFAILTDKSTPVSPQIKNSKVSNGLVQFTLGKTGGLSSLRLVKEGVEFVPSGKESALIRLYQDQGDAWDTPLNYQRAPVRQLKFVSRHEFRSEIEAGFEIEHRLDESVVRQRISLRADSPLVFITTTLDWHRPWSLLRANFPCAIPAARATYEIQFGWIERSNHENTSWDTARHECPHQQWVDLSNTTKGLAILNDGKYGSVVKDEIIELSLLRSVPYPNADVNGAEATGDLDSGYSGLGKHECRYALFPHAGNHVAAGVWRKAREFNIPPTMHPDTGELTVGRLPSLFTWRGIDNDFDVSAFKISESGDGVILRINRFTNSGGGLELDPEFKIKEVWETNLLEEPLRRLLRHSGTFRMDFQPFEIKTILFRIP